MANCLSLPHTRSSLFCLCLSLACWNPLSLSLGSWSLPHRVVQVTRQLLYAILVLYNIRFPSLAEFLLVTLPLTLSHLLLTLLPKDVFSFLSLLLPQTTSSSHSEVASWLLTTSILYPSLNSEIPLEPAVFIAKGWPQCKLNNQPQWPKNGTLNFRFSQLLPHKRKNPFSALWSGLYLSSLNSVCRDSNVFGYG